MTANYPARGRYCKKCISLVMQDAEMEIEKNHDGYADDRS